MKWIVRSLGALLTIALVALLGLFIFANNLDANQYREEIETAVKKLSGYTVDMRGPLALELFPVFQFSVEDVRLADPTGLSENLAVAEKVSASVKLLPLLERKLQIGSVRLHHLKLHLINDQNGQGNWKRIPTEASEKKNRSEKSDASMPLDFKVDSLELSHAELVWDDRQNQQYFRLSELQLETGTLLADAMVKFRLSGNAYAKPMQENSRLVFTMDGQTKFDGAFEQIELQDLTIQARYADEKRAYQPIEMSGHARLQLDQGFDVHLDSADVFDGAVQARVQRKTHKAQNQWRFELQGKDLAAEQVIAAISEEDAFLHGRATIGFEGTTVGIDGEEILKNLDGRAQLSLRQAELSNAPRWARAAAGVLAFFKIGSPTDRDKNLLSIQSAEASLQLVDGVADSHDLDARMPLWTADGVGTIDFVQRQVDYTLRLRIKNGEDPIVVPIVIQGPFERLNYTPQWNKIITGRAGEKIKEKVKQGREKIEKKINPPLDELKEKINDKLKDLLKF